MWLITSFKASVEGSCPAHRPGRSQNHLTKSKDSSHRAPLIILSITSWLNFGFVDSSLSQCWPWLGTSVREWKQILNCSYIWGMIMFSIQLTAETTNFMHTYKSSIWHIPLIQFPERWVLNSTNSFNNCFGHCALEVHLYFIVFFRRRVKFNQL